MLIDPCAAFAFVAVVLNVVGVTIHRVNNPVKPFGKKFFKSSTTWIQQQTRLLISYTKRRASKPTSSATEPFVTPSQRRRTTRARFPPPAPTPIRQLTVQPIVIDLVAQCRPHVAQLQLPLAFSPLVYDEFDVAERSLSLRGPTSLDLYTASAVCSILLPFVSTPRTLSPATPRLALPDGSPDQGDAWALEFSWFGAAVSLVLVLLALHKIFPSKGQQTVRRVHVDEDPSGLTSVFYASEMLSNSQGVQGSAKVQDDSVDGRLWYCGCSFVVVHDARAACPRGWPIGDRFLDGNGVQRDAPAQREG